MDISFTQEEIQLLKQGPIFEDYQHIEAFQRENIPDILMEWSKKGNSIDNIENIRHMANANGVYGLLSSKNNIERRAACFIDAISTVIQNQNMGKGDEFTRFGERFPGIEVYTIMLFLSAGRLEWAKEAASAFIRLEEETEKETDVKLVLMRNIRDLASGEYMSIIERSKSRLLKFPDDDLFYSEKADIVLYQTLIEGIEMLASEITHREKPSSISDEYETSHQAFSKVYDLSRFEQKVDDEETYVHIRDLPHTLSKFLLAAHDGMKPLNEDCPEQSPL